MSPSTVYRVSLLVDAVQILHSSFSWVGVNLIIFDQMVKNSLWCRTIVN